MSETPASPQKAPAAALNTASSQNKAPASERFEALPEPYRSADYSAGRRTFKLCGSCHTVNEGGQNLVGPNLHGIFGRKAGSLESFRYSDALKSADLVWTPEHIDQWLSNPKTYLPGNNMSFVGVRKPSDREAVIAYLMLESGYLTEEREGQSATPED